MVRGRSGTRGEAEAAAGPAAAAVRTGVRTGVRAVAARADDARGDDNDDTRGEAEDGRGP